MAFHAAPRGGSGSGSPGNDGQDGKSAYTIAVENGFVGTESQWLSSLEGSDGQDGIQGPQGLKGDTGATGPAGADGQDGATGPQGVQGPIGLSGADGQDGSDGAQGPQGDTGATGPQGVQGPIGLSGADGQDGSDSTVAGPQGPQGLQGIQGPQGVKGDKGDTGATGPAGADGQDGTSGGSKEYCSFYLGGSGGLTGVSNSATTLVVNQTSVNSDTGIFSLSSNQVTVNKTGNFNISSQCYFNNSSTSRSEFTIWLEINNTEVPGTRTATYQRGYDSGDTASLSLIVAVTSGDVLRLRIQRTDGGSTAGYQDPNGTRLTLVEM